MKTKRKPHEFQTIVAEGPKTKTLDVRLGVAGRGFEQAIKRSFNMAKSAGRELDVFFCLEPDSRVTSQGILLGISPAGNSKH